MYVFSNLWLLKRMEDGEEEECGITNSVCGITKVMRRGRGRLQPLHSNAVIMFMTDFDKRLYT